MGVGGGVWWFAGGGGGGGWWFAGGAVNWLIYLFLAATKQLNEWYFPSVRPSVCLSVTLF